MLTAKRRLHAPLTTDPSALPSCRGPHGWSRNGLPSFPLSLRQTHNIRASACHPPQKPSFPGFCYLTQTSPMSNSVLAPPALRYRPDSRSPPPRLPVNCHLLSAVPSFNMLSASAFISAAALHSRRPLFSSPLPVRSQCPYPHTHSVPHLRRRRAIIATATVSSTALSTTSDPSPSITSPSPSSTTPPSMLAVIRLMLPERRAFLFAILAALFSSTVLLATPLYFSAVLDIIASFSVTAPNVISPALSTSLFPAIRRLVVCYALYALSLFLETATLRVAAERIVASLRRRVFSSLIRSDIAMVEKAPVADLISRLSTDTQMLQRVLVDDFANLIQGVIEATVATVMLFVLSPPLALYFSFAIPLSLLAAWLYGSRTSRLAKQFSERVAESNAIASELLTGIRQIKSYVRESFAELRFSTSISAVQRVGQRSAYANGLLRSWNRFIVSSGTLIVLLFGGQFVARGTISMGKMLAFILYNSQLAAALSKFSQGMGEVVRSRGAIERVLDILAFQPVIELPQISGSAATRESSESIKTSSLNGSAVASKILEHVPLDSGLLSSEKDMARGASVRFENVSFRYPATTRLVLHDVSFSIDAGTSVAMVGRSGGGKSTAAALISRFYDTTEGEVLVGGRSLREYDVRTLRRSMVAMVEQQAYVISGSIAENIGFGREDASREDILNAADAAGVMEFIDRLPGGLDGSAERLSGGERQRVMIARGLVKGAPVVVLDEPTSALDGQSESLVNETIERLVREGGRTVVLISHRLAAVRNFDRILVFDEGRVAEAGTHEELVGMNGVYRRLLDSVDGE